MPWPYWASFYTPRKDFACRLLHQQHQVEKEAKPLLRRKNVNEATDKRKLFISNTGGQHTQPRPHGAKGNLPNCIEKTSWPPDSPDINPVENLWNIIDEVVYKDPTPSTHEGSEKTAQTSLEEYPLLTQYAYPQDVTCRSKSVIKNGVANSKVNSIFVDNRQSTSLICRYLNLKSCPISCPVT